MHERSNDNRLIFIFCKRIYTRRACLGEWNIWRYMHLAWITPSPVTFTFTNKLYFRKRRIVLMCNCQTGNSLRLDGFSFLGAFDLQIRRLQCTMSADSIATHYNLLRSTLPFTHVERCRCQKLANCRFLCMSWDRPIFLGCFCCYQQNVIHQLWINMCAPSLQLCVRAFISWNGESPTLVAGVGGCRTECPVQPEPESENELYCNCSLAGV